MKLRGAENYDIGLDLGTSSVGWSVVDPEGNLLRFKGKPTWGSRLFEEADKASTTRKFRGQRRRIERRRWRLDLLQGIFDEHMKECDPEFFIRLRQSRLLPEDRKAGHSEYRWPLFNDSDFTERNYYKKFPTIYHLRKHLMTTDEKADLRLVYLALHNIVKCRGHFIWEGQEVSSQNSNMELAVTSLMEALEAFCEERGISLGSKPNARKICEILKPSYEVSDDSDNDSDASDAADVNATSNFSANTSQKKVTSTDRKTEIAKVLGLVIEGDAKAGSNMSKAIAGAIVGLKSDMKHIFPELDGDEEKFELSDDEKADGFIDRCPDDGLALYESMRGVYSAYVLQGLLSLAPGKTLSENKVCEYERYKNDLKTLKCLVRKYASKEEYKSFFKGDFYKDKAVYDASKAKGYTKYNLKKSSDKAKGDKAKSDYKAFKKDVEELFADTAALEDPSYKEMMQRFDEETFLRRLKTRDNGSIPHQLHLEEMGRIIENQGRFYPFLLEEREKLESLVRFRIPYYVGPLTQKNAATDPKGNNRFAWSERKEGMEDATVLPWNWEEVIDRAKSAENFIVRMTGECTYLKGADVLPRNSLLYEEYCVLNELNGAKWTQDGDTENFFDAADRKAIVDELFKNKRTVRYKDVAAWMESRRGHMNVHVFGGQGETGFESKLNSHRFFCKDVLGVDELTQTDRGMVENIILWNTLFEDRKILREKLVLAYGERLSKAQIDTICKKRFTGWGRLSRDLLVGVSVETDQGPKTIMDVLREGSPINGQHNRSMVLMQVLRDERLGFGKKIDALNAERLSNTVLDIFDLPGSPAIRRSINQALRIVEEITKIAGHPPRNIFVEVTREGDSTKNKGKRSKKRYDKLKAALEAFKKDCSQAFKEDCRRVWDELKDLSSEEKKLNDEKLMLYFSQCGRCLYSGDSIDINRLHTGDYEVDHIIPRSYVVDNGLDNKALVVRSSNQRKNDDLLIDSNIRRKRASEWAALHDAKLMSDKKYNNLMRSKISDEVKARFIARQLVETAQSAKTLQTMLTQRYPESRIIPVKAGLSSELRKRIGVVKCREANDFHHAHDAYLACRMGQFVLKRHPAIFDNPIGMAAVVRKFVRREAQLRKNGETPQGAMPGSTPFLVASFMSSGFDKETGEIFKDDWDAEAEVERIRQQIGYKDCFISHMPYETRGAFWDQTIYSPRDKSMGKNLSLPLKKGLSLKKYGGFSSEQFAYFFIYVAENPKKKNRKSFEFAEVPVRVASQIAGDQKLLERYAKQLAAAKGLVFVRIAKSKVLKNQLIKIDGDRLRITGKRKARYASELAFSIEETKLIRQLVGELENASKDEEGVLAEGGSTSKERIDLFDRVSEKLEVLHPKLAGRLNLRERRSAFLAVGSQDQGKVLLEVIAAANGVKKNKIDLSAIGGGTKTEYEQPTFSNKLSSSDFMFIDQSVTGMFERRYRLEL